MGNIAKIIGQRIRNYRINLGLSQEKLADKLVAESICLAEEYKLLAEKLNVPFVNTREWNIELTFDGVHFTEAGHHAFAENLRKELRL